MEPTKPVPQNFLREIIEADLAAGTHGGRVALRFPPEPNGFPHLGHAKSICLNFGLARSFGGVCNLRYDDTNPETERPEYVEALADAVRWLGFEPAQTLHTSDYFERLYEWAVQLVRDGKAYVDSLNEEAIRATRGTVTEPGTGSPFRDRSVSENLDLLAGMRAGAFADGTHVLRARIDMAHPNMKMRDPVMYRIRHAAHYRRGDAWSLYPLYDWAHGQSDAIEGITHSLCTLEFDVNRELYDWYLDALGIAPPRNRQYEFARLNLDYTVMSKRKLLALVNEGHVAGWDDPRLPTIAGLRRRGVTPSAVRAFCDTIGVTKTDGRVDVAIFEHAIREELNATAPRVLAVLRPLRVVLTNVPEGIEETLDAPLWPHDVTPPEGTPATRPLPFTRELYIERDDFADVPPKGWHRLAPGAEVRLRHAYVIRCDEVIRDAAGEPVELRCSIDPETRSGNAAGRKVKGVVHWISATRGVPCEVRLYDRLFTASDPEAEDDDFRAALNPDSLVTLRGFAEPSVRADAPETRYQFERHGYFWRDPVDSRDGALVFNRIVALRDSWGKVQGATAKPGPVERASANPTVSQAKGRPSTIQVLKAFTTEAPDGPSDIIEGAKAYQLLYGVSQSRVEFERLIEQQVDESDAWVLIDATKETIHRHFEAAVKLGSPARLAASIAVKELRHLSISSRANVSPQRFGDLVSLVEARVIRRGLVQEVLNAMGDTGDDPSAIIEARGLRSVSDDAALVPTVEAVLEEHAAEVARYQAGETRLLGFLTGQALRRTGKSADPARVQALLRERLGA